MLGYGAPTRAFWRLDKPPTHINGPAAEQFSWEFERFCMPALQGNPTVLEVLWSPLIETITADGERLLAARRAFLSRRVAETYGSYARDQLDRVAARRERTGEPVVTIEVPPWAAEAARALPRPLLFVTVSGAHLYGFASVDSDLDLRAAHLLSPAEVVGLRTGPQTLQHTGVRDGVELDVVSHDLLKFARLLNSRNGYVLEQLLSPLVVVTTAVHAELRSLAPQLITRHHAHHYLGFAATQERLYAKTGQLKAALYTLRVLLTGLHLMRTGRLETDLGVLGTRLAYVPDLIAAKREAEHGPLPAGAAERLGTDVPRLRAELEAARDTSALPDHADPAAVDALHDLVVRTRLA